MPSLGDIVTLSEEGTEEFYDGYSNPHGEEGVVVDDSVDNLLNFRVNWNNGCTNVYSGEHLSVVGGGKTKSHHTKFTKWMKEKVLEV